MLVRETSREVYERIKTNGLLSEMRWKVYDHLFNHGPLTAGELTQALKRPDEVHPSYHRRLDELATLGCARRTQIRVCRVTGNEVYEWDVTSAPPEGRVTHASNTPTPDEMRKAVEELRGLYRLTGSGFSPELKKVCAWLAKKAK